MAGKAKRRKLWSDADKERALAVYATTGNMSEAARSVGAASSTFKRWLRAPVSDRVQKAREKNKERFVREAWDTVSKGITVGNSLMGFVVENADRVDEAFKAVARARIDPLLKGEVLRSLASLSKINIKDLAYYIGIVYDKRALAEGSPTGISRVEGQVTDTHEYKITETIIASHPELLDVIFPGNQQRDVANRGGPGARPGMGEVR